MPVSTGTAANAIALSALTPPFGTISCSDKAHPTAPVATGGGEPDHWH
jgi:threonine aldolase